MALSLDICQRSELAPKKIDKTEVGLCWLSLTLSVTVYGADAHAPSHRLLPVAELLSSVAALSGKVCMRVSDHHFLVKLVMLYLLGITSRWVKFVRGDLKL